MKLEKLNLVELNESEQMETTGGFLLGILLLGIVIGWLFSGGEASYSQD